MTKPDQVADVEGDGSFASVAPVDVASVSGAAQQTRREARAAERAAIAAAEHIVELPTRRSARDAERSQQAARQAERARPSVRATRPSVRPATQPSSVRVVRSRDAVDGPRRTPRVRAGQRPTAAPITAPRGRSKAAQRTTRFSVLGAMVFVGATIVSTSVPANAYFVGTPEQSAVKLAVAAQSGTTVGGTVPVSGQDYVASRALATEAIGRDGYSVTSPVVPASGTSPAAVGNSNAAVRWPFPTAVPISSGFGARQVANCSFCSTFHQGLDFTPGSGTPIEIVADGVVSKVDQGSGALGYNVWIDHVIGGQKVTTVYAHMLAGSIEVTQGETVKGGQIVGKVGSTGNSTGAHLHFEVHLGGVPVDPYPWLVTNAGAE